MLQSVRSSGSYNRSIVRMKTNGPGLFRKITSAGLVSLLFFSILPGRCMSAYPTTNVIQRTFLIRFGNSQGTAFTIDRAGRQYLVTARHVLEGIKTGESINVWHEKQWKPIGVNVIGVGEGDVDVIVLACGEQVSPTHPLKADGAGLIIGQQAYFLGFPFGLDSGGQEINRGLPIPFVKSGVISAFSFGNSNKIYVDAHVNEGFSGGPLVFSPQGHPNVLHVTGVVVAYPTRSQPVVDAQGKHIGYARENPGLVLAIDIKHVVELIDANPVGFKLPADTR